MVATGSWHMTFLSVILLSSYMCCAGFNVDIDSAVVHYGTEKKTKFGYRAEFLKDETTSATRLLVSAPYWNVRTPQTSGTYFLCNPLTRNSCKKKTTTPPDSILYKRFNEDFGVKHEMFGVSMTVVNSSTALMCGPLWRDMESSTGRSTDHFTVGRCQLIPPGNATLSPLKVPACYINETLVNGGSFLGFVNGLALFGFSTSWDKKGHVVIGTPGYGKGKGSFGIFTLRDEKFDLMKSNIGGTEGDSYLGFAVVAGNFCRGKPDCLAVSNRMPNGQVYVVARVEPEDFLQIQQLNDSQSYSSFGFSLCAMDINGDGLSDLLVGAPAYSNHTKDPPSYDEGRVFVYLQEQGKLTKYVTLAGDQKSFALFGSAIGDIGDVNRDSRNDVAVGAPQEDEGRGAVYIYLGRSGGPATTYSQRISGRDVDKGLFSFGSHISQPTSDLSPYQYPDFAVGSPESDAVVFLRTRLIINAEVNIVTPPSPISSSNSDCPAHISPGSVKASGCILLQVCLNVSVREKQFERRNVSFDLSVHIDTLVDSDPSRRVRVYRDQDETVTSVRDTVSVEIGNKSCETYHGLFIEENIRRNRFVPLKVAAAYVLNISSLTGSFRPILNGSRSARKSVKMFMSFCGEDKTCRSDLAVEGGVLHEPSTDYPSWNVVNVTNEVVLYLNVTNKAETAYGLKVLVNIEGQITFKTATDDEGGSGLVCGKDKEEDEDDETKRTELSFECTSWLHLHQGEATSFRLLFKAASVPLQGNNLITTFSITALPYESTENPDVNTTDNTVILKSRKVIVADILIAGSSDPRAHYVYNSEDKGLEVSHTLLVINKGPSFMPATDVDINVPYMGMDTKELLASQKVIITHADGRSVACLYIGPYEAGGAAATGPSTEDPSTVVPEDVITFPYILPNRRRRGADDQSRHVDTEPSDKNRNDSTMEFRMDCKNYRCNVFRCGLPLLQPAMEAKIIISLVINSSVLPFSEKVVSVTYVTTGEVKEPQTPFFYKWTKSQSADVHTPIYQVTLSRDVNIWIIVGGIIGGLLALTAIVLILRKLGFFRRRDKARLQKLKRESGFYRRMERPSSSAHAITNKAATEKSD